MLPRQAIRPDGHWRLGFPVNNSQGLRCGPFLFVAGQVDLDAEARVVNPGDLMAQTTRAMNKIGRVLADLGLGFENVVKVNAFYAGDVGERVLRENAEVRFSYFEREPGPVSTGVPLPYLAYEDMVIEIDVVAMV
jgi:enamine deaminase RidA (YjgF/YER057c/UK114 family)